VNITPLSSASTRRSQLTKHVVMWSGGITSWATARLVIERHGKDNTVLLFADTNAEDEDLHRWNRDAAAQLGMELIRVADPEERDPWQVFEDARWIGNTRIALCSHKLKQEPCRDWLADNTDPASTVLYVGLDWTEPHRIPAVRNGWAPWPVEFPLTEPPFRDKEQLNAEARALGLEIPRLYGLGFAHNNCGGACVKGGQAQWVRLLEVFPERFAKVEAFEQRMRTKLGKDVSILRDRTGGTTKPLTLAELRSRVESSAQPSLFDDLDWGGCGCFTDSSPEADAA
jgi:hypothetical protein